jgi:hypothetical protein
MDDPAGWRQISEDARKGAELHLNINHLAKELVETYHEVISFKNPSINRNLN